MRLKVLLWTHHPHDILGDAIDFVTHGIAQHAGWQDIDGTVVEAYWPRLRRRNLVLGEESLIKAFTIKDIEPAQELALSKQMALDLTHPPEYSGWDLIKFLFNAPNSDENHTFCSRYVQHTIERTLPSSMWPQIRVQDADWVSPRDLYISNLLIPCNIN